MRCRRLRRAACRFSKRCLIASPRWINEAANTTSPEASLTIARPVVLLPGSSFTRSGQTCGEEAAHFKMIVNGYLLKTAACPDESSLLALPGCTGLSACLFVSKTNTLLNGLSFCSYEPLLTQVMVASTRLWSGLALVALP